MVQNEHITILKGKSEIWGAGLGMPLLYDAEY